VNLAAKSPRRFGPSPALCAGLRTPEVNSSVAAQRITARLPTTISNSGEKTGSAGHYIQGGMRARNPSGGVRTGGAQDARSGLRTAHPRICGVAGPHRLRTPRWPAFTARIEPSPRARLHPQRPGLHLSQNRRNDLAREPVLRRHDDGSGGRPGGHGVRLPLLRKASGKPKRGASSTASGKIGNAEAEQAFQNIDRPLAAGIERWRARWQRARTTLARTYELATLARKERDELPLAAVTIPRRRWRLLPDKRAVLVDLGRTWKANGPARIDANGATALLALPLQRRRRARAARSGRRELLPDRYPLRGRIPRRRSRLRSAQRQCRRELGLICCLRNGPGAGSRNRSSARLAKSGRMTCWPATQLGFLLHARGDDAGRRAAVRPSAGWPGRGSWPHGCAACCTCRRC